MSEWHSLTSSDQLENLIKLSHEVPVLIFKHSTRCGISAQAKDRLKDGWKYSEDELPFYYLDLLSYRPISNAIADRLGVFHQSPQVIMVWNGEAIYDASHYSISVDAIDTVLQQVKIT